MNGINYDDILQPKTAFCCNKRAYFGNRNDRGIVFTLWTAYFLLSLYLFLVLYPFFWVNYSPAILIVGIFLSIPGLYNAIKCFATDPGILKRGTYVRELTPLDNQMNIEKKDEKQDNPNNIINEAQYSALNQDKMQVQNEIKLNQSEQNYTKEQLKDAHDDKEKQSLPQTVQDQQANKIASGDISDHQKPLCLDKNDFINMKQEISQNINNSLPNKVVPAATQQIQKGGDLFQERYCSTCNIMRPPLASHCSHCNNCVKEFDHHCFFMGNCIGQRNQLNFVMFLSWTNIWCIYSLVFSSIHFSETISQNAFVFENFYENKPLFYIFIASVMLFIFSLQKYISNEILALLTLFNITVLIYSFFSIITEKSIPYYSNPVVSILGILVSGPPILVLIPLSIFNCYLACIGSTTKQQSYKEKNSIQNGNFSFGRAFSTFWTFIAKNQPKSEILG